MDFPLLIIEFFLNFLNDIKDYFFAFFKINFDANAMIPLDSTQ